MRPRRWSTRALAALLAMAFTVVAGCNSQSVRTTDPTPVASTLKGAQPEELLDVGIDIFDPGLDTIDEKQPVTSPAVRQAEARYIPNTLKETLQRSGNWGAVRVIPDRRSETDVWVEGKVLKSDGDTLKVQVRVGDASGKEWFDRVYEEQVSKYAYDDGLRQMSEPFQGLYNRVANDMLEYRQRLDSRDVAEIRTIAELKFAQDFAPEAFDRYLETDGRGNYTVKRLPAENDPIMQRIKAIRERDHLFVDTLQEHYNAFARQLEQPYRDWRSQAYRESRALKELNDQATANLIGGALAVLGGILAQGSGSQVARTAGVVGIGAGAYAFKRGLDKRSEAQIHAAGLQELADSLGSEVRPYTVELEDRKVTLTGTVEEQYEQWRQLLAEMYAEERGAAVTTDGAATSEIH